MLHHNRLSIRPSHALNVLTHHCTDVLFNWRQASAVIDSSLCLSCVRCEGGPLSCRPSISPTTCVVFLILLICLPTASLAVGSATKSTNLKFIVFYVTFEENTAFMCVQLDSCKWPTLHLRPGESRICAILQHNSLVTCSRPIYYHIISASLYFSKRGAY